MAANLFGTPVTDATVKLYYPDAKEITRKMRAQVAFQLIGADSKNVNADNYVLNLKNRYGDGIATLCAIYNATGDTLTHYKDYDYYGHIGEDPYPNQIQNGQWAAFLHVHRTAVAYGSSAALVYTGLNDAGDECGWLNAWSTPWSGTNYVYTEIRPRSHYDDPKVWGSTEDLIKTQSKSDTSNGCYSISSISESYPYKYVGTMTLEGVH